MTPIGICPPIEPICFCIHVAGAGLGVACLSHWVVSDLLATDRLRQVQTTLPKMARQCYLVVHQDKQHTPAMRQFIHKVFASTEF